MEAGLILADKPAMPPMSCRSGEWTGFEKGSPETVGGAFEGVMTFTQDTQYLIATP